MKLLLVVAVLVAKASSTFLQEASSQFHSFKLQHGKHYKSHAEEAKRFDIFRNNLKAINEHNQRFKQRLTTWEKGVTQFTDLTDEEFRSMLKHQFTNLHELSAASTFEEFSSNIEAPQSRDWRKDGAVTPVRNEGLCGASWAFSIVGSIEGAYHRKTGKLAELSVQQLIDCTNYLGNEGCNGGFLRETFPYAIWHGLQSEASYPYKGKNDSECRFNSSDVVTKIDNFKYFSFNQYELQVMVGNFGPVSTAMDAGEIRDYKSGIYNPSSCSELNPNLAVLVVGYGSESEDENTNFWIVKNSWGTSWGEDGYFRIGRRPNDYACGLYFQNVLAVIN